MDIGFFLSDLLLQNKSVNVPGLGTFSLTQMSARYDEKAEVFYPPYHKITLEFEPEVTDDTLARLIADEKGISLASSQYFVDKYVTQLKQQATNNEAAVGTIGWFYTNIGELNFKPQDKFTDGIGTFYGYEPIKLKNINELAKTAPVYEIEEEESIAVLPANEDAEASILPREDLAAVETATTESEEYTEELLAVEEKRNSSTGLIIAVVALAVIGLGLFALYTYAPASFEKLQFWKKTTPTVAPAKSKPVIIAAPKPDSLYTDSLKKALTDSTVKATDTVKTMSFELITASFKTKAGGLREVERLIGAGLSNAKILENAPGKRSKISVGSFETEADAEAEKQKLIKAGKITAKAYVQPVADKQPRNTTSPNK